LEEAAAREEAARTAFLAEVEAERAAEQAARESAEEAEREAKRVCRGSTFDSLSL
jgi:hypothetical protein